MHINFKNVLIIKGLSQKPLYFVFTPKSSSLAPPKQLRDGEGGASSRQSGAFAKIAHRAIF